MAGALHAIANLTRWYPRHAERIVGTSAGSVLAALGAAGVPPWLLIPDASTGIYRGRIDESGLLELDSDLWARIVRRNRLRAPRLRPGSMEMLVRALRTPSAYALLKMISGLAPAGFISTEPIKETVRWIAPTGWVDHPSCWIVACDYASGERVVFGRDDAPDVNVAEAVAASCAIPGYYVPEVIDGRMYVDGGLHSMTNADLLLDHELDLVVLLSPHSSRHRFRGWNLMSRFTDATRRLVTPVVDAEIGLLEEEGVPVLLLEPTAADLAAIGGNLMDESRRAQVMRMAMKTTAEQLATRENRKLVEMLHPAPRAGVTTTPAGARLRPATS
jgi:NTE family protein